MLAWMKDLTPRERRTMGACFGGWSLDAFDVQMYSFVIPTVIALWGLSKGEAGLIGTVTLLISSLGGWFCGTLADRFGRVRMLQITILWYSFFTFLCAFAQNFEQLFVLRALHGLGFGGEWAAGAVLMGEVIRDKYRGRGVGLVQTGWAVGWGGAALVYTALYAFLPEAIAWRVLFGVGLLPAVMVFWIRRHIEEPEIFGAALRERPPVGAAHLFAAFRGPYLWTTIKVSLMVAGAQGGGYALGIWMPTYLRTVRGLSAPSTGGFLLVQILGALIGFLIGTYLSDAIGRKWTFLWSAIGTLVMVLVYMFLPMNDVALLFLGIPLNIAILMKFPPMGTLHDRALPDRGARDRSGLLLQRRTGDRGAVPDDGRLSQRQLWARRRHCRIQHLRFRADGHHAPDASRDTWPQPAEPGAGGAHAQQRRGGKRIRMTKL